MTLKANSSSQSTASFSAVERSSQPLGLQDQMRSNVRSHARPQTLHRCAFQRLETLSLSMAPLPQPLAVAEAPIMADLASSPFNPSVRQNQPVAFAVVDEDEDVEDEDIDEDEEEDDDLEDEDLDDEEEDDDLDEDEDEPEYDDEDDDIIDDEEDEDDV